MDAETVIYLAAGTLATTAALLGVLLTLITLPGIWVMLLVALLCQWWQPEMYSWWTLGAVAALSVGAEIAEFFSSAAGAAKAGASKTGLVAATVGGIIGAILGTAPFPIVGTIVGGVAGAFVGAALAEGGLKRRPTEEWRRIAHGAATGRLLSTLIKTGFALPCAALVIGGAFIR